MTDSVTAADVQAALRELANPVDATHLRRFFKTGPGEYGEGDVFLGVRVPASRGVAKRFAALPLDEVDKLLDSEVHEDRFAALVILNARFAAASMPRSFDDAARAAMVELYLAAVRRGRVNNWDLVDVSAEHIVGAGRGGKPPARRFERGPGAEPGVPAGGIDGVLRQLKQAVTAAYMDLEDVEESDPVVAALSQASHE
uniref:DNA alkylation repair protein n=1 Tax=Nocardia abscessus TaxID=120957 RepID=UPI0024560678